MKSLGSKEVSKSKKVQYPSGKYLALLGSNLGLITRLSRVHIPEALRRAWRSENLAVSAGKSLRLCQGSGEARNTAKRSQNKDRQLFKSALTTGIRFIAWPRNAETTLGS